MRKGFFLRRIEAAADWWGVQPLGIQLATQPFLVAWREAGIWCLQARHDWRVMLLKARLACLLSLLTLTRWARR